MKQLMTVICVSTTKQFNVKNICNHKVSGTKVRMLRSFQGLTTQRKYVRSHFFRPFSQQTKKPDMYENEVSC